MMLFSYLDQHSPECQQALLARTDCEELHPGHCANKNSFRAHWNIDLSEYTNFSGFVFEGECEIGDFFAVDGYLCNGVQGNNADPFHSVPPGIDGLSPFEADPSIGTLTAVIDEASVEFDIDVTDVRFRKQIDCDETALCAFRLEQMRLSIDSIDLGDGYSLTDLHGGLFFTAAGTHSGDEAVLPASSLQILIVGSFASEDFSVLDGLPFVWIVHNSEAVTLHVTESPTAALPLFGIDSATISLGALFDPQLPTEFELEIERTEYSEP